MNDNQLAHYGILGMKWGIRRYQNKDGTLTPAGKKRYSESDDYKNAHSKKSVREMSDAELRARVNRLQMEAQYSRLSDTNISRGKKRVSSIWKGISTVSTASATLITLYKNADTIRNIIEKSKK